jgi:hypothetical protein
MEGDDCDYYDGTRVLFACATEEDDRKQSAKRGRGDGNDAATFGSGRMTMTNHDLILHQADQHAAPVCTVGGLKLHPHQQPASSLQHAVNHNQASEKKNG